jgi:hypothetical protein
MGGCALGFEAVLEHAEYAPIAAGHDAFTDPGENAGPEVRKSLCL